MLIFLVDFGVTTTVTGRLCHCYRQTLRQLKRCFAHGLELRAVQMESVDLRILRSRNIHLMVLQIVDLLCEGIQLIQTCPDPLYLSRIKLSHHPERAST